MRHLFDVLRKEVQDSGHATGADLGEGGEGGGWGGMWCLRVENITKEAVVRWQKASTCS